MILLNVTYTSKYDSNLILLGQLCKSGMSYHNHPDFMIFMQEESIIGIAGRYKNLFILETGLKGKAMLV